MGFFHFWLAAGQDGNSVDFAELNPRPQLGTRTGD
jgi:hypothetical protein